MRNSGELERENEALRDRLSRLSEASLRHMVRSDAGERSEFSMNTC